MLMRAVLMPSLFQRPQVHDIVLEYAESQFTEEQLTKAHRTFIKFVQASRPTSNNDGWCRLMTKTDRTAAYVETIAAQRLNNQECLLE